MRNVFKNYPSRPVLLNRDLFIVSMPSTSNKDQSVATPKGINNQADRRAVFSRQRKNENDKVVDNYLSAVIEPNVTVKSRTPSKYNPRQSP